MISIAFRGDTRTVDSTLAVLVGAEGLDASAVEAQTEEYASIDGARLAGVRASRRDIRLRYAVVGDPEDARQELYRVFEPKTRGTLYITTGDRVSGMRTLTAEASAADISFDPWARSQELEAHLVCPDPWLYGQTKTVEVQYINDGWDWRCINRGMACGYVAQVGRKGYIRTTRYDLRFAWDASSVLPSDAVLTLDTREGHKDLYIEENGVRTSYIQYATKWDFETIPGLTTSHVRSDTGKGPLSFTERWLGI